MPTDTAHGLSHYLEQTPADLEPQILGMGTWTKVREITISSGYFQLLPKILLLLVDPDVPYSVVKPAWGTEVILSYAGDVLGLFPSPASRSVSLLSLCGNN